MSQKSPTQAEQKAPRPSSLLSRRLGTIVQAFFLSIALIAANFLSCTEYGQKDLSQDRSYQLSEMSLRLLESEALVSRETPVKLIIAFTRSHPFTSRLLTIAEQYRRNANGKVEVEIVDPIRNPNRAEALSSLYRISFTKDLIIVDGRPGDAPVLTGKEVTVDEQTQLELSSHIRFLDYEDIGIFETNDATGRDLIGWQDEDSISSAILSAVEGKARKIYFIADKTDLRQTGDGTPWKVVAGSLYHQNIAFIPLSISTVEKIPDDADGIALIAPQYDFNDREMKVLENYWNTPSSSILAILDPKSRPPKLRTFFRDHGITLRNDRVLTVRKGKVINAVRATFTSGPEINKDLAGNSTQFDGSSSSLEVRENANDLDNRKIYPIALLQAQPGFWGETDFTTESPTLSPDDDSPSPIFLAAAVIKGEAKDDQKEKLVSRMVVISNSDFLEPKKVREENIDFLKSSTNWLIGREELIGTPPKSITTRRLTFLSSQLSFINNLTLFLMPALALAMGAFVWSVRRR